MAYFKEDIMKEFKSKAFREVDQDVLSKLCFDKASIKNFDQALFEVEKQGMRFKVTAEGFERLKDFSDDGAVAVTVTAKK